MVRSHGSGTSGPEAPEGLQSSRTMAHFGGHDASGAAPADFFDINDLLASSFQHGQQQPRDQEDPSDPDSGPCWGALLTGGDLCTPGFKIGRLHFKNKYCDNVRNPLLPPPTPLTSRRPLSASSTARAHTPARPPPNHRAVLALTLLSTHSSVPPFSPQTALTLPLSPPPVPSITSVATLITAFAASSAFTASPPPATPLACSRATPPPPSLPPLSLLPSHAPSLPLPTSFSCPLPPPSAVLTPALPLVAVPGEHHGTTLADPRPHHRADAARLQPAERGVLERRARLHGRRPLPNRQQHCDVRPNPTRQPPLYLNPTAAAAALPTQSRTVAMQVHWSLARYLP